MNNARDEAVGRVFIKKKFTKEQVEEFNALKAKAVADEIIENQQVLRKMHPLREKGEGE
jgi:hypothetical protein